MQIVKSTLHDPFSLQSGWAMCTEILFINALYSRPAHVYCHHTRDFWFQQMFQGGAMRISDLALPSSQYLCHFCRTFSFAEDGWLGDSPYIKKWKRHKKQGRRPVGFEATQSFAYRSPVLSLIHALRPSRPTTIPQPALSASGLGKR